MSHLQLSLFRLSKEWCEFFEKLPSWKQLTSDVWSDGNTLVELSSDPSIKFGFYVNDASMWKNFLQKKEDLTIVRNHNGIVSMGSPSGLSIEFHQNIDYDRKSFDEGLCMNHVAVDVSNFEAERRWYERLLGNKAVLARDSVWDPVKNDYVKDAHLFDSQFFYITLRESTNNSSTVNHVGWMTAEPAAVDEMAELVSTLKYNIVYGPIEIDGSYLFHFEGPDHKIHDFYCPLATLSNLVEGNK